MLLLLPLLDKKMGINICGYFGHFEYLIFRWPLLGRVGMASTRRYLSLNGVLNEEIKRNPQLGP